MEQLFIWLKILLFENSHCRLKPPDDNNNTPDEILEKKVQEFGPHWCKIAEFLPGRTNVNIKNRWTVISKKKNKRQNCKSAKISLPQPVPENSVTSPDDFKDFESYTVEMAF